MRPIDADALMKKLGIGKDCSVCEQHDTPYCRWKPDVVDVCEAICEAPNIEVQPDIVHCSDCKYWHREIYNGIEYFNLSSCDLSHHGDGNNFYCADAKRREE